jgi:hypothetical protein
MVVGGYRSVDVMNLKGRYQEPYAITAQIFDHRNDHYVRLNRVAFKYPNFKKEVDPNAHVRVFNFIIKVVKTFEEYIINAFNYMLRNIISDWCHNYMLEFLNYTFSELTYAFYKCHQKI